MHCQPYMIEAIATLTMGMSMFIFDSLSDMSSNDKQNASFPCQNCRVVCAILFHFFRSPTATCLRDPIRGYMVSLIHQNQAEWYMTKFHPTARREYQRLVTLNADSHKQRCHRRPVIKDSSLPILHVSSRPTCVRLCGAVIYHIPILICESHQPVTVGGAMHSPGRGKSKSRCQADRGPILKARQTRGRNDLSQIILFLGAQGRILEHGHGKVLCTYLDRIGLPGKARSQQRQQFLFVDVAVRE